MDYGWTIYHFGAWCKTKKNLETDKKELSLRVKKFILCDGCSSFRAFNVQECRPLKAAPTIFWTHIMINGPSLSLPTLMEIIYRHFRQCHLDWTCSQFVLRCRTMFSLLWLTKLYKYTWVLVLKTFMTLWPKCSMTLWSVIKHRDKYFTDNKVANFFNKLL